MTVRDTSMSTTYNEAATAAPTNSTARVATASIVGTAIEFYDFYIYATAAALVIGPVFFPQTSGTAQMLASFLTFGIAFIARPLGSALFGHFGDRIGRKSTLVASLLLMGVCTTLIGLLPGYDSIGAWAPILLCVLRFAKVLGFEGLGKLQVMIFEELVEHKLEQPHFITQYPFEVSPLA
ncbi:MFS transporter, partial [Pseudomonas emilianonis]